MVNYRKMSFLPSEFIDDRIALYNALFPKSLYKLLGFTKKGNDFCFVLRQPYIKGHELLKEYEEHPETGDRLFEEIKDFLNKTLNLDQKYLKTYINDEYIIEDVHLGNVMRDDDTGDLVFIDVVPSLNTPDDEYQGKNYYREFNIVDNE